MTPEQEVEGSYLELEVELVLWVREPIPLELGIWSADQPSWAGRVPELLSM